MTEFILENWPIYFKDLLITKDPKNNIGIVCLWTKKNHFKELKEYNTIGNLYSLDGINYLLKNLASNRHITKLIVCGMDLSNTGKNLIDFFAGKELDLCENITIEEKEKLRKNIEIIDMRNSNDLEKINNIIETNKQKAPYSKASFIETSETKTNKYPIEDSAIIVREEKIAEAWLKILKTINDFGTIKESDYSIKQREILNLITVTNEDLNNIYLPDYLELKKENIEEYSKQITTNKKF